MSTVLSERKDLVHRLWDELASLKLGDASTLTVPLRRLCQVLGAQEAYWIGAVQVMNDPGDPATGWRPQAVQYLHGSDERKSNYKAPRRLLEAWNVDPSIIANLKNAGDFRVHSKRQLVGESWFGTDYYRDFMAPFGIQDALLCAVPVETGVESWWVFQRINSEHFYFADEEVELLRYAARPLAWLHKKIALHHGLLLAEKPLTASERRLVRELLTRRTEKEIAVELNLSPATVHTYAVRTYRKFGVRGRAGLMALWLGQH